jgi:hypothetical protein
MRILETDRELYECVIHENVGGKELSWSRKKWEDRWPFM